MSIARTWFLTERQAVSALEFGDDRIRPSTSALRWAAPWLWAPWAWRAPESPRCSVLPALASARCHSHEASAWAWADSGRAQPRWAHPQWARARWAQQHRPPPQ